MYQVWVEESFAAAHQLRGYRGKCENLHGHNYKVRVTLEGPALNSIGLLCDFKELKDALHGAVKKVDHTFLNELAPFDVLNPSAENIAKYFYDEVARSMSAGPSEELKGINPPSAPCRVREVTVWEADITTATYSE
ncbi:MAG: 6-carboxytetrahydropterin synthase QueD [Acidobacteria bacterium]|nr:6-carboxytetrahydropterin synthase QueD [Acidobacteriota bacterium]